MQGVQGRADDAIGALNVSSTGRSCRFAGWTIPIEPLFAPLRERTDFKEILTTLAAQRPLNSSFFSLAVTTSQRPAAYVCGSMHATNLGRQTGSD